MAPELWEDELASGQTQPVADIDPGPGGSDPIDLVDWQGGLYFAANDGTNSLDSQLWSTDVGTGTTSLVQTFDSGITGDAIPTISELVYGELGTELLVSLNDGIRGTSLWETDGSGAGTQFLSPVDPTSIAVFDGTAYFLGTGGGSSYGLWKTNGTAVGTTEVMDLSSYGQAPEDYDPQGDLVTSGSHLFFITGDSKGGVDVWSSDGTSQGTGVVRDFAQSPGSSAGPSILELTPFDTSLAFVLKADSGARPGSRTGPPVAPSC